MSSSGGGDGRQGVGRPNPDEVETGEALLIGAAILGLLMALVVIRFGFNIFLDCCVLGDRDRAWNSISKVCRCLFPWWNRRTEPTRSNDDSAAGDNSSSDPHRMEGFTSDLELQQRARVDAGSGGDRIKITVPFLMQLPSSILTAEDIEQWRQKYHSDGIAVDEGANNDTSSPSNTTTISAAAAASTTILCSICIHELEQGDTVFIAERCNHVFHKACMSEWVMSTTVAAASSSSSSDNNKNNWLCPNCRMDILSRATRNQMFRDHNDRDRHHRHEQEEEEEEEEDHEGETRTPPPPDQQQHHHSASS